MCYVTSVMKMTLKTAEQTLRTRTLRTLKTSDLGHFGTILAGLDSLVVTA